MRFPKHWNAKDEIGMFIKERREFDACGMYFYSRLKNEFNKSNDLEKKSIINTLKSWLYNSNNDLPIIERKIIEIYKTDKRLFRKFQSRVFNFYKELENEF